MQKRFRKHVPFAPDQPPLLRGRPRPPDRRRGGRRHDRHRLAAPRRAAPPRRPAARAAAGTVAGGAGVPGDARARAPLGRTSATRFTPDQHAAVAERAKDCCLSVAAYIRVLVLGGTPIARRSEVRSAIVAVNRVGTNLNQLVKLANSGILLPPELLREIHAVRAEIGTLRQAFLAALRDEPDSKGGA